MDVLVHGEYERNDMVEYFGEALGGFLFTEKAWVQSYGTRCVKPPIIGAMYIAKSDHGRVVCLCAVSYEKDHEGNAYRTGNDLELVVP